MNSEFKYLEDLLAMAIKEKATRRTSARVRAMIHLAKVARADVTLALADVERRIEQSNTEIDQEPNRKPFLAKVLMDLRSVKERHVERLLVLDEIIARAEEAAGRVALKS